MNPDDIAVSPPAPFDSIYYPPISGDTWETTQMLDLEWDETHFVH